MKKFYTKNKKLFYQLVSYGIIGAFSATLDTLSYYLLRDLFSIIITNIISVNVGITVSFFLNTFFNFKITDKLLKRAISFYSVGYIGLVLSSIILYIGTALIGLNDMVVKICSVFIVAMVQFVLNKFITYKR